MGRTWGVEAGFDWDGKGKGQSSEDVLGPKNGARIQPTISCGRLFRSATVHAKKDVFLN